MSDKDSLRLLHDLKTNEDLRSKLTAAGHSNFEQVAKHAGYHVTRESFAGAIKHYVATTNLDKADSITVAASIISAAIQSIP